jgi:hypothetical protein
MIRDLLVIVVALFGCCFACGADVKSTKVLVFSLAATNRVFEVHPEVGFALRVTGESSDWDVDVSRSDFNDYLLYPSLDWHGAYPCQIMPWSFTRGYFPDERVIRVRGCERWVRIRLVDAKVGGAKGSERFTNGRVEVYWQDHG